VGPVLEAGAVASAILAAIREENPEVHVEDRGAYWRIGVARRCQVTRLAIERHLGRGFRLPGDLELVMPSFQGRLIVSSQEAAWELAATP
jgi:hypothetical protein